MRDGNMGAVFMQTNEAPNTVVAYRRAADGTLTRVGSYETGGAGNGEPHLPSQGSVALTSDRRHLLVTNAASDDVSLFAVAEDGSLQMIGRTPAGSAPKSVAEHAGLVYVLATGKAAVLGFRLGDGGLEPSAGRETGLSSTDADPAQVGFSPDGSALFVTERGTDSIVAFAVGSDGSLGARQVVPSSGPTPYGFGFANGTMVVTEAFGAQRGAAAASSYAVDGATVTPITRSLGNGRSEICWAVVTPDGRHAYTTNFADGAVSCYGIGPDGSLTLVDAAAGVSVDGRPGLRDEALSDDGRFLYAIDADSGTIFGWAVGDGGSLSPIGQWGGLPMTAAGLAAM